MIEDKYAQEKAKLAHDISITFAQERMITEDIPNKAEYIAKTITNTGEAIYKLLSEIGLDISYEGLILTQEEFINKSKRYLSDFYIETLKRAVMQEIGEA